MKPLSFLLAMTALLLSGEPLFAETPTADEIARQVDHVNRFNAVRNITYGIEGRAALVLDLSADGSLRSTSFERRRRNDFPDGQVAAKDLVIFRSGNLRGTGILVTDYTDQDKGRAYAVWLPSLRKVRRFTEPDPADTWGNSNFTYGDIYTRRPRDETHELLGRQIFNDCLGAMQLPSDPKIPVTSGIPTSDCSMKGKDVFRLRSRPKRADPEYDERIVFVDAETFADYRSVYYRGGEVIKTIDKSWRSMGITDPRAQYWLYWYANSKSTGQQGMAFVDSQAVSWNDDLDADLWSERTLSQIRR